jgi:membrane fusion protein, heavy metal efflux system
MAISQLSAPRPRAAAAGLGMFMGALVGAALLYGVLYFAGWLSAGSDSSTNNGSPDDRSSSDEPSVITFAESKQKAAGIRTEVATYGPLLQTLQRPGRIGTDPRKTAHLSPMVDGIVRDVHIRRGDEVKAGATLLVLDSKELGLAKLELAKARLALSVTTAQHDWTKTVNKNTAELLATMAQGMAIGEIEKRFVGRAIGEWRQQLITAYSRRNRAKVSLESQEKLESQGAGSAAALRAAQGEFETADATLQALREEIHFQNQQQLRAADEKLRAAQGQVSVAETNLLMVGYSREEVTAMDPVREGAKIGHYPIRAPFDGTALSVSASLGERAGPQAPVLQLADLSRVTVEADLMAADIPALRRMQGRKVTFNGPGVDGPLKADVFHVGDIVDEKTRTIPLVGYVDNPDHRLKPGMFVDVELQYGPDAPVVHLPASAIQRHAGETFVFVPKGEDQFERIAVRLGRATRDRVEIVEGIQTGQPVVVEGSFALKTEMLRATLSAE